MVLTQYSKDSIINEFMNQNIYWQVLEIAIRLAQTDRRINQTIMFALEACGLKLDTFE